MTPGDDTLAGAGGAAGSSGAGAGTAGSGAGGAGGVGTAGSASGASGDSTRLDAGRSSDELDASAPADAGADSGVGGCAPDLPLRQRPENDPPLVVDGSYDMPDPGWARMVRDSDWVLLRGQGYVALRWEIEYANLPGEINLPTITFTGRFFRVGGGGGYNLDDPKPGTTGTYMGNPDDGQSYMAPGAATPWHIDYYYLDGEVQVTLHENASLNIEARSRTIAEVRAPGSGIYSPGVVCDHP